MEQDTPTTKEVSPKSTKKQLWDAYQSVLQGVTQKHRNFAKEESFDLTSSHLEEEKTFEKIGGFSVQKAMGDIGQLKMSMAGALNDLGDKITEELKKLELVDRAISLKNENLKNVYQIESEAINLFDLIEAKEKERVVLQNSFGIEKEKLERQIAEIKKQHEREEEEYQYNVKIARQQDENENDFKNKIKERDFNEKLAVKQKEVSLKEIEIGKQENEMKEIKLRFEKLPEEIESIKSQTYITTRQEVLKQVEVEKEFLAKDYSRESEIAKLKVFSLEEIIKQQSGQINNLEGQLSIALQKAQELAVKIIESGKQDKVFDKPIAPSKENNYQ